MCCHEHPPHGVDVLAPKCGHGGATRCGDGRRISTSVASRGVAPRRRSTRTRSPGMVKGTTIVSRPYRPTPSPSRFMASMSSSIAPGTRSSGRRIGNNHGSRTMAHSLPGRMVEVGGVRFHVIATGRGRPSIVLEAALGASALSWSLVQPAIANLAQAVSYDRAGFGWSDPAPGARTAGRIATELRELLQRAAIEPPFLLVGHSFGGLVIRVFAARHRPEVAGLLFVDT